MLHFVYSKYELIDRYMLPRDSVITLEEELHNEVKSATRRNHALSPIHQLPLALLFYATGSFQRIIGDTSTV